MGRVGYMGGHADARFAVKRAPAVNSGHMEKKCQLVSGFGAGEARRTLTDTPRAPPDVIQSRGGHWSNSGFDSVGPP